MATIKRQLQRLLPGVRVFLDVDDLDDIANLEAHIQSSAAVLVYLGSMSYFESANCMREVRATKEGNVPLVRVHESDMTKGSASLAVLREACPVHLMSQRLCTLGPQPKGVERCVDCYV